MAATIERRIRRTILAAIVVTFFATVASVLVANENLERSLLELDFQSERAFIIEHARPNEILVWNTGTLRAYYAPAGMANDERLPPIFHGYPVPFSGEIEVGEDTFLITTAMVNGGRLYLAKDITVFEHREEEFHRFLSLLGIAVILLGVLLAAVTGRRVAAPIALLTGQIRHTAPAPRMKRVQTRYDEIELQEIAQSFNLFLGELEAYVRREQSFMGLASHELRTPIAVIAGALDVIEQRGALEEADRKTLKRIRRAVEEMTGNIEVILELTRRKHTGERRTRIDLAGLAAEVVEDLTRQIPTAAGRMAVSTEGHPHVHEDPVLVKMLLRNLLQNAVQHTSGKTGIHLTAQAIEVVDEGVGLPEAYRAYLNDPQADAGELLSRSGFGLFIITLLCERLSWSLAVVPSSDPGTTLRVSFTQRESPPPA